MKYQINKCAARVIFQAEKEKEDSITLDIKGKGNDNHNHFLLEGKWITIDFACHCEGAQIKISNNKYSHSAIIFVEFGKLEYINIYGNGDEAFSVDIIKFFNERFKEEK